MDELEMAHINEEDYRRHALAAHYRRRVATQMAEYGAMLACGEAHSADRIISGERGKCCDCGDAIAPARLQTMPDAVRCVGCQKKTERKDRSRG